MTETCDTGHVDLGGFLNSDDERFVTGRTNRGRAGLHCPLPGEDVVHRETPAGRAGFGVGNVGAAERDRVSGSAARRELVIAAPSTAGWRRALATAGCRCRPLMGSRCVMRAARLGRAERPASIISGRWSRGFGSSQPGRVGEIAAQRIAAPESPRSLAGAHSRQRSDDAHSSATSGSAAKAVQVGGTSRRSSAASGGIAERIGGRRAASSSRSARSTRRGRRWPRTTSPSSSCRTQAGSTKCSRWRSTRRRPAARQRVRRECPR